MLLSLLAIALGATAGSASAVGWQPSVNAETGDKAAFANEIAVDAQGNAVGVWARHVSFLEWEIVASSRPRGGQWTVPVAISGDTRTGEILRSKVAVDPSGNAVAVWAARPPEAWGNENVFKALWSASRSPGGVWGEPEEISVASGVSEFDVVIDGSGTATAIWHSFKEGEDDPPGNFVRAASRPLNGVWSDPVELSGTNGANAQVAVNPAGDLTAVWSGSDPDTDDLVVRTKSRPAGEPWDVTATDLSSDSGRATGVQVAVDPDGNAVAAWSYSECIDLEACEEFEECTDSECREGLDVSRDYVVQTAYRSETSGTWSGPTLLWDDTADENSPQVALAVDPQGNASAIWSSFGPGGNLMRSSTRTAGAGGAWSTPVELSTPDGGSLQGKPTNPRIVADPQGSLTATWSAAVGPNPGIGVTENRRLQAVHRPAGGAWGAPVALSTPDDVWAAEIAADPLGYVTTLWSGTNAMRSRVFDSVAPLLQSVTVPTTGVVGEPVAMSVDPFDVWSSVATGWDFGDGDSGSGATVSHCYSTPGEQTVTIAGTDLAANTASATRTIEIEADPEAGSDPCAPDPDPDPDPNPESNPDPDPGSDTDPGPGTDPDSIAPVVTGLQQSSSRWRVGALGRRSRPLVGTVFRFRLNRAADVKLLFSRIAPGGKARPRGALRMAGDAGANALGFGGKIRGRTLAPGRYRLTVTAHADGMKSAGASLEFTIVR
jgi:PKD domain